MKLFEVHEHYQKLILQLMIFLNSFFSENMKNALIFTILVEYGWLTNLSLFFELG